MCRVAAENLRGKPQEYADIARFFYQQVSATVQAENSKVNWGTVIYL